MPVSSIARHMIIYAVIALAVLTSAQAREKSDIIVLKNGNNINGEIQKLFRGILTVTTDSMGTVEIKWEDVEQVTSKYIFSVEDTYGRLYVGALQPAANPRQINIIGQKPIENLDHISVVEIREVGRNFWRRFSGSIDLGYTFTKASERTQFNLNSNLIFSTERYSASIAYDTIFSNSKGEKDIDRRVLTLESHRYMGRGWQVFGRGKWEHNLELELDERFSFLGGPAYDAFKTNRSVLRFAGGISYTKERYFEKETVNNAEAAFGTDYQLFKLYTPKIDWTNNFFVYPNLTTSGRVRLEFDTKLRLEIFKDFFVNFSFYDSYDNQPPSETATKNDYGFVTGVSWSFN